MSVLACDRYNCDNIMCDRLILNGTKYICDTCYDELIEYKSIWPQSVSKVDVEYKIQVFMISSPGTYKRLDQSEIQAEFDRLVGN